jgi:hypothetical protein
MKHKKLIIGLVVVLVAVVGGAAILGNTSQLQGNLQGLIDPDYTDSVIVQDFGSYSTYFAGKIDHQLLKPSLFVIRTDDDLRVSNFKLFLESNNGAFFDASDNPQMVNIRMTQNDNPVEGAPYWVIRGNAKELRSENCAFYDDCINNNENTNM